MPGYEGISAGVTRLLVPGYEGICAGVRGYWCRGTRVLVPRGTTVLELGYESISAGYKGISAGE